MKIVGLHFGIAVLIMGLGYGMTSVDSLESTIRKEDWSLSPARAFDLEDSNLRRLSDSNRWEVNLEVEEESRDEISSVLNVSKMKLVGVILGEPPYALIEVENNVQSFKIGDVVLQESQALLIEIEEDKVQFSDGNQEYSLFIYPELKDD